MVRSSAPVTIDSRTLKTNYNVLDNSTGAEELWLRTGFEMGAHQQTSRSRTRPTTTRLARHWLDSETYAFNTTTNSTIDRDRFFVGHNQHRGRQQHRSVPWTSNILRHGQSLRRPIAGEQQQDHIHAARRRLSRGHRRCHQSGSRILRRSRAGYPQRSGSTRSPCRSRTASRPTPWLALIGGVRVEHMTLNEQRRQLRRLDSCASPSARLESGFLSRGRHDRAGPQPDVLRHDRDGIRSSSCWHLLDQPQELAGIDQRAHLRGRCQATVLGQQGGVEPVRLRHRPAQRLRADQHHDLRTGRRGRDQGVEFAAAVRPVDGLKLWGNVAFTQARYRNFDFSDSPATRLRTSHRSSSTPARPTAGTTCGGRSRSAARCVMSAAVSCLRTTPPRWSPTPPQTSTRSSTFRAKSWAIRTSTMRVFVPGPQPYGRCLRRVLRSWLSGPDLSRRAADL